MGPFRSILFDGASPAVEPVVAPPAYFADLNLDQVVASITAGRDEYGLEPFFSVSLESVDAVAYRHEVARELERDDLSGYVRSFAEGMRATRAHLAQGGKLHYAYQKQRCFVDAVRTYCDAVEALARDLRDAELRSRGFAGLRDHLASYVGSGEFTSLRTESAELEQRLADIDYAIHIRGARVSVRAYDDEADYSREVEETFARFRQGAVKDYRSKLPDYLDMNHVEAQILHDVARLNPDVFGALTRFCEVHREFLDDTIERFDREVQFYVAYLAYVDRLRVAGLSFCYPRVSDDSKELRAYDTFDVALAGKLLAEGSQVVCNDLYLEEPERIIVVSGPNQGGKTTFARTFGQLHHLASLGLPVAGRDAQLLLFDALFTHFEKEEDIADLSGKLQTDLERIHAILEHATPRSVVIMNESFSATTLDDAIFLGTKVLEEIIERDLLCVCVTFVDELASLSDTTVSMVSTIVPGDPASRTFKLERRPADGLAYAAAIAEKYGLTYEALRARVAA